LITGRIISNIGKTAIFPSLGLPVAVAIMVVSAFYASALSALQIALIFGLMSLLMGTVMCVVQLTVQSASGPRQLGAGSATVQFSRSLGAAIGTALVGAVLFISLNIVSPEAVEAFSRILQDGPKALENLGAAQQAAIQTGLGQAFRNAFLCIAAFGAIGAVTAWSLPMRRI
jgi:hypothetical protein